MAKTIIAVVIIIAILGGAYYTGMLNYNTITSISPILSSPINKITNKTLEKINTITPSLQNSHIDSKTANTSTQPPTAPPVTISIPKIPIPAINNPPPEKPTDLASLYVYALKIVNDDRKAHGLNPVALSGINSAQYHADDQLRLQYFSHWNSDGVKPYVVYTKLGGKGLVAENDYNKYSYCPTSNCVENTYDPYEEIKNGENEMMTNDAASHWGHRDNIIDPHHTHVNFGIAYDNERFYFVENFENNLVNWQSLQLSNNRLHLLGTVPTGYSISQISIFSDSAPKILTSTELNTVSPYNLGYYDQGTLVGDIVPMPKENSRYVECTPGKISLDTERGKDCVDYITFVNNSSTPNGIDIYVDVSKWSGTGSLHTFYLSLKDQDNNEVEATSLTLEYLK